eukprot:351819-Chlamydomonas_euryale.AAC.5
MDVREMLKMDVKKDKGLVVGQLDNGFRYVVLPNKLPPTRFEAHLEVHVGSVDEGVDEQVSGRDGCRERKPLCIPGLHGCGGGSIGGDIGGCDGGCGGGNCHAGGCGGGGQDIRDGDVTAAAWIQNWAGSWADGPVLWQAPAVTRD